MIFTTDTVIDPRTMMVMTVNTFLTDEAVGGTCRFDDVAEFTE